jgi:hypothetical protein
LRNATIFQAADGIEGGDQLTRKIPNIEEDLPVDISDLRWSEIAGADEVDPIHEPNGNPTCEPVLSCAFGQRA